MAFVENLRLEKTGDAYRVVGDITSEKPLDHTRGLSISVTSTVHEPEQATVRCYLPYPAYTDPEVLRTLRAEGDVTIGRLQKKGLTDTEIGLIAAVAILLVSPEWDIQYRTRVRPQISKALSLVKSTLTRHSIEADLNQVLQVPNVGAVSLVLIPDRSAKTTGQEIETIDRAIDSAIGFIQNHERKDIQRLRSVFYANRGKYEVVNVQYMDGNDLNIVP